jgi:O-antigen/teichoic acid export membrane protein
MSTMTAQAAIGSTATDTHGSERPAGYRELVLRYGLSAFGPIAVSGAHFVASVVFLHSFSRADFGLFAFLLVVVPFCLSLSGSLLGVSITSGGARSGRPSAHDLGTHMKASLLSAVAAALSVTALLYAVHAPVVVAAVLGLYGGVMTLRWFARSFAYAMHTPFRAATSDFLYSVCVIASLTMLLLFHELTVLHAAIVLTSASVLSLAAFGWRYLAQQFWPGSSGALADYAPIWRDITRWSLMGVVLTEMTANAHAYLVTLISGPGAFAMLAIGALLMRPISLVYAALPDLERPAMARAIAAGDAPRALRIVKQFRTAVGAVWVVTVLAAGAILIWFPHLVLKQGYGESQALIVTGLSAAIMAVRAVRTPESVLLQAAREFKPLARTSLWSSVVSLIVTLALLLVLGPIASLGGILAGEGLMTANIVGLSRRWRRAHA